jgi:hypothetical protein
VHHRARAYLAALQQPTAEWPTHGGEAGGRDVTTETGDATDTENTGGAGAGAEEARP